MRAADLLQKVLERKAEGEIGVPSYDNMHTPDNHVGNKNMKPVKTPEKGLDVKRDEHPTAEVGMPGKEKRSMEGPGTKPKKVAEEQLNELIERNPLVAALNLRYDGANEKLLVNHPGGVSQGQSFYLPISRGKLERVLMNPDYRSSPLSFYTAALRQSRGGPGRAIPGLAAEQVGGDAGGTGGRRRHAYLELAQEKIDSDDEVIYDVAVNQGQMVRNVKHMKWFRDAVADWLEEHDYPVVESAGELAKPAVTKMSPSHSASVRAKQPDEPKNKGEPGMVKKKEKRADASGCIDANPVTVADYKGGQNEHKSMKKMHEGISALENFVGRKLDINLGLKKKLSEARIGWSAESNEALRQYMDTALWASSDNGEPMDDKYSVEDFAPETLDTMEKDVARFLQAAGPLLTQALERGYEASHIGHDFWLTRNGHGAGYWDRRELEEGGLGNKLTDIAQKFGEATLYVGDDGKIYQFHG